MPRTRLTFHQVSVRNHQSVDVEHVEGATFVNFETDFAGTSGVEPEWLFRYVTAEPLPDKGED